MGGLGPGIGGMELLVIGLVALLVVGPKDLPVLLRRVGQLVAKARGMAADFRASFDEMARQTELDELRKEVEALRKDQGLHRLSADADAAFRDIRTELERPAPVSPTLTPPEPLPVIGPVDEWPDATIEAPPASVAAAAPELEAPKPKAPRKPRAPKAISQSGEAASKPARAASKPRASFGTKSPARRRKAPEL